MKAIIGKWLERIKTGYDLADHTEMLSDRGFLIHVTQAYPSLVPYLKGIHLTLETWHGHRDEEGWKLSDPKPHVDNPAYHTHTYVDDMEEVDDVIIMLEEKEHIPPPS